MKPLHKAAGKDELHPALQYIMVKNGFAVVTNCTVLLQMPIKEVFGDVVSETEELYFNAKEWEASKMDKALFINRDGLVFQGFNRKGDVTGTIVAKSAEQFRNMSIGFYPDYTSVIALPEIPLTPMDALTLDVAELLGLTGAFACKPYSFCFYFYGRTKHIIVKSTESGALGLIMPTRLECPEHPFFETKELL